MLLIVILQCLFSCIGQVYDRVARAALHTEQPRRS